MKWGIYRLGHLLATVDEAIEHAHSFAGSKSVSLEAKAAY